MKQTLKWLVLWPLIVRVGRVAAWIFPPLGFVLWRKRVRARELERIVELTARAAA